MRGRRRKQVSKAVTQSTHLKNDKYLTNSKNTGFTLFPVRWLIDRGDHVILVKYLGNNSIPYCIIVFIYHAEVSCSISTHAPTHTSALTLSGFSLRSQFSDPVTTYTACVLSLGSAGITMMNGSNTPRHGQMLRRRNVGPLKTFNHTVLLWLLR